MKIPCEPFTLEFPCKVCGCDTDHYIIFVEYCPCNQTVEFQLYCLDCFDELQENVLVYKSIIPAKQWEDIILVGDEPLCS